MTKQISTPKLSAAYRKLQDAQDAMMAKGKAFWAFFKTKPLDFDMESFNSTAKELNLISSAEGAQASSTLALNGLMYLASRVRDLEEENKSLRRRLERLEADAERKSQVPTEQQPTEVDTQREGG